MTLKTDQDVVIWDAIKFRLFLWNPFDPEVWEFFIGRTVSGFWFCVGPIDFNIPPKEAR